MEGYMDGFQVGSVFFILMVVWVARFVLGDGQELDMISGVVVTCLRMVREDYEFVAFDIN
jgi:hypothetical protein